MNMKKVIKITVAILLAITLITAFTTCAFAAYPEASSFDDQGNTGGAENSVTNIIGAILTIAQYIGVGVAVIMLVVLAIKYIAASPEGKGEIKKTATVYIVGAIILFAASALLQIIKAFATNIG